MDEMCADLNTENLASFNYTGFSQIMVEPVPQESISGYGVVNCGCIELSSGQSIASGAVVENQVLKMHRQTLLCLVVMYYQPQPGIFSLNPLQARVTRSN